MMIVSSVTRCGVNGGKQIMGKEAEGRRIIYMAEVRQDMWCGKIKNTKGGVISCQ